MPNGSEPRIRYGGSVELVSVGQGLIEVEGTARSVVGIGPLGFHEFHTVYPSIPEEQRGHHHHVQGQ